MKIRINFIIFTIATILFSACKTIEPVKPQVQELSDKLDKKTAENRIIVPVEIKLDNYFKQANQKIPKLTKGADTPCSGVRYVFEFSKDSFEINTRNNKLLSELYGSYWIKMNYCAGCTSIFGEPTCITPIIPFSCGIGEKKPSVKIALSTDINLNSNYGVESNTIIDELKPLNPCEVTVFHFDATGEVMKQIKRTIESQCKELDKQLSQISFEQQAKEIWKSLSQSMQIPYIGYLHINPKSISLVKPTFKYNKLQTSIILDCSTAINSNQNSSETPLPKLNILSKAPKDTFEIYTDIQLNCDSLSAIFTNQIKGHKIETAGKTFQFEKVTLEGLSANNILIAIEFTGSKNGILYLTGTPTFNNETKKFSLENLTYDLETKSTLLKTAKWLFDKRIYSELSKVCTRDMNEDLNFIKNQIETNLYKSFGDYELKGKVHDIGVKEIAITNNDLYMRTALQGQLKIKDKK